MTSGEEEEATPPPKSPSKGPLPAELTVQTDNQALNQPRQQTGSVDRTLQVGTQIWIGTPADGGTGYPSATKSTYEKFDGIRARLTSGNSAEQGMLELKKSIADKFQH